jgi:hypothetical protein
MGDRLNAQEASEPKRLVIKDNDMKAYGLPRISEIKHPDLADIRDFGFKSSASRSRGKGGDIKNSFRRPSSKRLIRRAFKKAERHSAKNAIRKEFL